MDEVNVAAPSSTEPTLPMTDAEREALPDWVKNGQPPVQEAGGAESGNASSAAPAAAPADSSPLQSNENGTQDGLQAAADIADAPAVGGGVDAPSHLLLLDAMLAEIERKIAVGIHLFAHEITAARDHLAKLL